jgi:hypothetical protein
MIHLHNTLSSVADLSAAGNTNTPVSQATLDSFRGALSDAVSSTLEQYGIDPNQVQVSITPASTSTPPATSSTGTSTSTATPSTAPNGGYDPFLQAASESWAGSSVPAASSATNAVVSTTSAASGMPAPSAATDPQLAFDNAYWAQQPAAVQPLRTMAPEERADYAHQLASEGYTIDVPIMVWGWDPSLVTSMRQADGYTWVPSAMQGPVETAPGLGAIGNMAAYDPNNPPAGSITVPPSNSAVAS